MSTEALENQTGPVVCTITWVNAVLCSVKGLFLQFPRLFEAPWTGRQNQNYLVVLMLAHSSSVPTPENRCVGCLGVGHPATSDSGFGITNDSPSISIAPSLHLLPSLVHQGPILLPCLSSDRPHTRQNKCTSAMECLRGPCPYFLAHLCPRSPHTTSCAPFVSSWGLVARHWRTARSSYSRQTLPTKVCVLTGGRCLGFVVGGWQFVAEAGQLRGSPGLVLECAVGVPSGFLSTHVCA